MVQLNDKAYYNGRKKIRGAVSDTIATRQPAKLRLNLKSSIDRHSNNQHTESKGVDCLCHLPHG